MVRQFNTEGKRDDLFSATPDSWFFRFQLRALSTSTEYAALIIDVSVAFMHADILEKVIVKVPKDIKSATGYWNCKKALNGTRKASQAWTEHSANELITWGSTRNDHNPSIFKYLNSDIEQHGDDFFCNGPRTEILALKDLFENSFLVKKAEVISLHKDDQKSGHFLHRIVSVDEDGWHEELEPRYVNNLIKQTGVEHGHTLSQPGYKESSTKANMNPLGAAAHTQYRSNGGLLQYMTDRRGDLSFSTKEVLRHAHHPTVEDQTKITRIARYLKGVPRVIQDFPWLKDEMTTLETYVDSDWSGEIDTRKSTSGGVILLNGTEIKHWCSTQPTVSLSSGEAEIKSIVKGLVEVLYIMNLLEQQGYKFSAKMFTDSSAAVGHCSRLGNGRRMRHLEGAELWIQQVFRNKRVSLSWVHGLLNPADLYTEMKHVYSF